MTPEEAQALINRALESRTLGVCLLALEAVKKLELCPEGTLAKLEADGTKFKVDVQEWSKGFKDIILSEMRSPGGGGAAGRGGAAATTRRRAHWR